jgi:hypothetical protein
VACTRCGVMDSDRVYAVHLRPWLGRTRVLWIVCPYMPHESSGTPFWSVHDIHSSLEHAERPIRSGHSACHFLFPSRFAFGAVDSGYLFHQEWETVSTKLGHYYHHPHDKWDTRTIDTTSKVNPRRPTCETINASRADRIERKQMDGDKNFSSCLPHQLVGKLG